MTTNHTNEKRKTMGEHLEHPLAHYYVLLGATIILLVGGLIMVASASSIYSYQINDGNSWALATRQLIFGILGVTIMLAIPKVEVMTIRRMILPFVGIVLILLVAVLIVGTAVYGQRNWIEFGGPFRIQPSEFAKLAVVLFGADQLERKSHRLNNRFELMRPVGIFYIAVMILILLQRDVGTAIVVAPIMVATYFIIGAPMRLFVFLGGLGLAGIAVLTAMAPYRMARFTSWINPEADAQGAGFQLIHGQQALGSGGIWGLGLGGSKEKWGTLPAAHTDFIYAVIGEELGFLGTVTVLFLFSVIAFVGLRIARHTDDLFIQIASFGIVIWLVWQMLVNVGAVLRIMPITGVPLPIVSYGGSSLLPSLAALGLLMSFALHEARKEAASN